MNCFDRVIKLLPATTPELAAELDVSIRVMNARMQFYKYRGLVKHNGRETPKTGYRGRRAKFWVSA